MLSRRDRHCQHQRNNGGEKKPNMIRTHHAQTTNRGISCSRRTPRLPGCLGLNSRCLFSFVPTIEELALKSQCLSLHCRSPQLMLWAAPPPACKCQRCGCCLSSHDSEELSMQAITMTPQSPASLFL